MSVTASIEGLSSIWTSPPGTTCGVKESFTPTSCRVMVWMTSRESPVPVMLLSVSGMLSTIATSASTLLAAASEGLARILTREFCRTASIVKRAG